MKTKARAAIIRTTMQTKSHSLAYFLVFCGRSRICPVVIRVIADMNRNAKGNDAVELLRGTSVRSITPASRPNIRKLSIISEVRMR